MRQQGSPAGATPEPPPDGAMTPAAGVHRRRPWWRLGLLVVLVGGVVAVLAFGGGDLLSFETLGQHHQTVKTWVEANGWLAVLSFVLAYVLIVTFSIPGAVWMSIAGGYLFGAVTGTALIVLAATSGATAVFLAARFILGDTWRRRVSGAIARLEEGFRDNAFSTLLVLRLVPLFPFWLVNLVPAFVGVGTGPYVAATALGIIPGAAVYAGVGSGFDAILERGETPDLGLIYDPEILLPLLGLAALAALPTLYKAWRRRHPQ